MAEIKKIELDKSNGCHSFCRRKFSHCISTWQLVQRLLQQTL